MKNFESIDETFKAMRQMPLEVSLNQVRKWISEAAALNFSQTPQTPKKYERKPKSNWAILKSFFPPINKN